MSLELFLKIHNETKEGIEAAGGMFQRHLAEGVVDKMVAGTPGTRPPCGGFVARADEVAEKFGDRFKPGTLLRKEVERPDILAPAHPSNE